MTYIKNLLAMAVMLTFLSPIAYAGREEALEQLANKAKAGFEAFVVAALILGVWYFIKRK